MIFRHFPVKEPLHSSSRLIIQLSPDSNGLYYCQASNKYGKAVSSLYVDVKAGEYLCDLTSVLAGHHSHESRWSGL